MYGVFARFALIIGGILIFIRRQSGEADSQAFGDKPRIPKGKPQAIPTLKMPAARLWGQISIEHKRVLLANVWCSHCSHSVTIKNFTGVVKSGDLLLVGKCAECHGDVARLVESA